MLRSLLARLWGLGSIPAELRGALQAEGIELLEESCWGSVTFRNYRAPRRYSSWRRKGVLAALALTPRRLVIAASRELLLDLPYASPAFASLRVAHEPGQLTVEFAAADLYADRRGEVAIRLSTPRAAEIEARLRAHGLAGPQASPPS